MSEFRVEVVRLGAIRKHPNADKLQITDIHGGYPTISQLGAFAEGDLAIYCPVDSMVPASHPAFGFLAPEPVRKKDATDAEWAERLRRHEREKTELVRIKAKKLRGTFSMGLLVSLKDAGLDSAKEGDDVQELLGIEKYEPDESNRRGGRATGPQGPGGETEKTPFDFPEYTDLEGLRKWGQVFEEGEEVVITEKIHGQNARYVRDNERLWCGSRHQTKRPPKTATDAEWKSFRWAERRWMVKYEVFKFLGFLCYFFSLKADWLARCVQRALDNRPTPPRNVPETNWWKVADDYDMDRKLKMAPGHMVCGEIYGRVQDLKYGIPDLLRFVTFDIFDMAAGRYLDFDDFVRLASALGIPQAPVLYRGPWNEKCRELAEGKTVMPGADHVREGIVIRGVKEGTHPRLGRRILKLVGQGYLLR